MLVIFYHMSQRLPGVMRLLLRFPVLSSRYLTRLTTRDVKFHFVFSNLSIPRAPQRGQRPLKQLSEEMLLFDGD
jgi:hypothetical protein